MMSKIDATIDTEKGMKNDAKRVKKRALKGCEFCFFDIMLRMLNLLKHVFYYRNTMFFEGTAVRKMNETCKTHAQNRCLKSVRKILVIWCQNGAQKGHLKRPKAYIFRHIFACYFRHVFDVVLGSKCIENGSKKGSKM